MAKAVCPSCRRSMDLDRYIEEGEFVHCPRCRADLEVISLHPLALEWADIWSDDARGAPPRGVNVKWSKRDNRVKRKTRSTSSGDEFQA